MSFALGNETGSECSSSPRPLDHEAPDCCHLLPARRSSVASKGLSLLWSGRWALRRAPHGRGDGLAIHMPSPSSILSAHSVTAHGMCRIRDRERERGRLLASVDSCSFQPRLRRPQIPSQSVFSARRHAAYPTKGLRPNYKK